MKVLTYVEGELTVINGSELYRKMDNKPGFISGTNFYYEPTLKMMDEVPLTTQQEQDALAYIDAFAFPTVEPVVVSQPVYKHYVDNNGNYMGCLEEPQSYIEVPTAPISDQKWYNGAWTDCVLIDSTTKHYIMGLDTRDVSNSEYAPNTLDSEEFNKESFKFINGTWVEDIALIKVDKIEAIRKTQRDEIDSLVGRTASRESSSFIKQESEARAWSADNTVATPFIDALLPSRSNGETKQQLVDKIIAKADAYTAFYASSLGKFQKLVKLVELSTTVDEVKSVVW